MTKVKDTRKGIMILSGKNNNLFLMLTETKYGQSVLVKHCKYTFDAETNKFNVEFTDKILIWLDKQSVGKIVDYLQKCYNAMKD